MYNITARAFQFNWLWHVEGDNDLLETMGTGMWNSAIFQFPIFYIICREKDALMTSKIQLWWLGLCRNAKVRNQECRVVVLKVLMTSLERKVVIGQQARTTSYEKTKLIEISFLLAASSHNPAQPNIHCNTHSAVFPISSLLRYSNGKSFGIQ